jgi:hypothetical protein
MRPDRWTQHCPSRCGATDMPEGYTFCECPPGWPRRAAYWKGETAIGARKVEQLLAKWRRAGQS